MLLLSRIYKRLSGLITGIKRQSFLSTHPRISQQLVILFSLPLSLIVSAESVFFEEGQHYREACKIVVMDDGSTGSRVVSYLFGRNYGSEEFRLIKQSVMYEASPLSLKHDGMTDESVQLIANLLQEDNCGDNCQASFFLGATAGKRTDEESAEKLFGKIREKLKHYGIDENKYDIEMKVLDGSMEGAYNWLGVNYFYGQGKPEQSYGKPGFIYQWMDGLSGWIAAPQQHQSYGIIELGGKSAQVAFSLTKDLDADSWVSLKNTIISPDGLLDKSFLSFKHGVHPERVNKVIAQSEMGFGLKQAYNRYEQQLNSSESSPCEGADSNAVINDYEECLNSVSRLFPEKSPARPMEHCVSFADCWKKENKRTTRLFWQEDGDSIAERMPDTYILSGYFYDYTVHLGLRSFLTLSQFEKAAQYACEHFSKSDLDAALSAGDTNEGTDLFYDFEKTLGPLKEPRIITRASDFEYSGSIQPIDTGRLCGNLTYMVSLLKHFGVLFFHDLYIVKSYVKDGKPYPATWSPGYAYAKANNYEINHERHINSIRQSKGVASQTEPDTGAFSPAGIDIKFIEEDIFIYRQQ